ncbi:MAG: prepilin-type N-terminal cleavage/methylation domain-containing protein [Anaerolineae bacterium]|nr:prepilin-type N-terminal cleavage/methylation domain-containing protein [Anaerolineae bacterium]
MKFRNNKGFTLIELLIVLAILGILVGIVAMSVGGLMGTARTRGLDSEKEIVSTAIDTYNTQDVAVSLSATIAPQATLVVVGPATTGFGTYLKRTTKYYYQWEAEGENLTQQETE